ncbi:MAG TPA: metallophosphoesterase [Terriglobales bacterium]|nr:metallophosphoesterase [Terriglobales bacterium]
MNPSDTPTCFFVSDLHGRTDRYQKLFQAILKEHPRAVFLGGDLFPSHLLALSPTSQTVSDFADDFLAARFGQLKRTLGVDYPRVFLILGNDDARSEETAVLAGDEMGLWEYVHHRRALLFDFPVFGYAYVPPTPFRLKDWERYDVSRYVDLGCISPEEGMRSVPVSDSDLRYSTIQADLENLVGKNDLSKAIFLFHSPPYQTNLDRAALDGKMIDHVPLDVNVGSIAVRRFIEIHQPLLTLHGHVHESARVTGSWKDKIGRTYTFSGAHDGPELALVRFRPDDLESATRELV